MLCPQRATPGGGRWQASSRSLPAPGCPWERSRTSSTAPTRWVRQTRAKVEQAIGDLGFVRNAAASTLKAGRSTTLGLLVLDIGNPFFTDVARGVEAAAAERGYTVLLCNADGSADRQQRAPALPRGAGRGRACSSRRSTTTRSALDRPARQGNGGGAGRRARARRHAARWPSTTSAADSSPVSTCSSDGTSTHRLRHRPIQHPAERRARPRSGQGGRAQRRCGRWCSLPSPEPRAGTPSTGSSPERVDAVFCANDVVALGLLGGLLERGVRVPGRPGHSSATTTSTSPPRPPCRSRRCSSRRSASAGPQRSCCSTS